MIREWSCHFCGRTRPDGLIAVASRTRLLGGVTFQENRRYCRDSAGCVGRAEKWEEEQVSDE